MADTSSTPWVLGLAASHNGSACLLRGDEIVAAVQEERLLRSKRARLRGAYGSLAVRYCLDAAGIKASDLASVVLCPQRSLSDPDEIFARHPLLAELSAGALRATIPHHLGHAIGAFATSGFEDAAVLVVDGSGSPLEDLPHAERAVIFGGGTGCEHASLYQATNTTLLPIEKHVAKEPADLDQPTFPGMPWFASLGEMYGAVAWQIFDDAMDGAGKVMGLAPYGTTALSPRQFFDWDDASGFTFHTQISKSYAQNLERWPALREEYANLAASVQAALEEALLILARRARQKCASSRLCYAGGVALNSVANERLVREAGFDEIFFMPAAEDSGTAIGAAYYGLWQLTGRNARRPLKRDAVGRSYSAAEIDRAIETAPGVVRAATADVLDSAVDALCAGQIIGWFEGRSELGPRALGRRSILCDPRSPTAKDVLNRRVKRREAFRPFAPAILLEEAEHWFELQAGHSESPFMLRVARFRDDKAQRVPAVVHVDGTGRLQTVTREDGRFHDLLTRFFARTGVPILLNTSFNVAGEPIVETPEDALFGLLFAGLDCCVFDDRIVQRRPELDSILDLYVELGAEWITVTLPGQKSRGLARFLDAELPRGPLRRPTSLVASDAESVMVRNLAARGESYATLRVTTQFGPAAAFVELQALHILRRADGKTTGRQILEQLNARGDGIDAAAFLKSLGWLQRARALRFRERPGCD